MISLREDTCATTIVFDLKIGKMEGILKLLKKLLKIFNKIFG